MNPTPHVFEMWFGDSTKSYYGIAYTMAEAAAKANAATKNGIMAGEVRYISDKGLAVFDCYQESDIR